MEVASQLAFAREHSANEKASETNKHGGCATLFFSSLSSPPLHPPPPRFPPHPILLSSLIVYSYTNPPLNIVHHEIRVFFETSAT
jgi:hypothetical protein